MANGALLGSLVTLTVFLAAAIFRMGHHSARIEALEAWRAAVRLDMHEISEQLARTAAELKRLSTLIEERTQRHRFRDGSE